MLHVLLALIILTLAAFYSNTTLAHCDTMDGPVVRDAQKALANKKVDTVLKWVTPNDEKTVFAIFQRTLEVRSQGKAAQELADQHFFEALVRIHRASEGECFTGIKPYGSVEPSIAASDKALRSGDITSLANELSTEMREGIIDRFEKAYKLQKSSDKSVKEGREFVQAYVELTHYVEGIHHIITKGASHKHRKE